MYFYLILTLLVSGLIFFIEKNYYTYFSFLKNLSKNKLLTISLMISCTISILILALRNPLVADDTYVYYQFFQNPYLEFAEVGFFLIAKITRVFTDNFHIFLLITSSLALLPFYYIVAKQKDNKWLYIFLYHVFLLYIFNFAIIRQSIAMAFISLGIYFYQRTEIPIHKKIFSFIFFVLAATLFHRISIIFLPLFLLDFILLNRKKIIVVLIISVAIIFFKDTLISFVFKTVFPDKSIYLSEQTGLANFGIIPFVIFSSTAILSKYTDRTNTLYKKINYFFIYISLFFFWFPTYGRILQFGYMNIVFLLGECFDSKLLRRPRYKYLYLTICLLIYIYLLSRNPYHVIPYYI